MGKGEEADTATQQKKRDEVFVITRGAPCKGPHPPRLRTLARA